MTEHDKKISGVETPVNPVQQQAGPSEGRRRLMKGALAAPAVMTLMSGRLAAAGSVNCVANLQGQPAQEGWVLDGWVLDGDKVLYTYKAEDDEDPYLEFNGQLVYNEDGIPKLYTNEPAVSPSCWASLGTTIVHH